MIDFRYHIVSLISVFLALAIGIVLGAGPLKDAIGDTLTGQVDELRTGKEELRLALTAAEENVEQRDVFLEGISDSVLTATLPGRRVAIVELEEVPDELVDEISERLVTSGAVVTDRVRMDQSWTSDSKATFRQSLASSLVSYLDPQSAEESTDKDLATALVQSLTAIDPEDEDKPSTAATDIRSLLAASDLVSYGEESAAPADMIVFISNPPATDQEDPDAADLQLRAQELQLQATLAGVATEHSEASVVVSVPDSENDLLTLINSTGEYAEDISTVARVQGLPGQMNIALALAARAVGTVGQYGTQPDATAAVPAVMYLDVVDRTARKAAAPDPLEPADESTDEDEPEEDADEAAAEEQE